VGTGEHGLVRVGTGDWSDGIVAEAKGGDLAVQKGDAPYLASILFAPPHARGSMESDARSALPGHCGAVPPSMFSVGEGAGRLDREAPAASH